MSDLEVLENIGTAAVLQLRREKLAAGKSFMINSSELPAKQSYMEYSDGSIGIVTIAPDGRSFNTLRGLSDDEAVAVRNRFNLH